MAKILVVDDNLLIRTLLREILSGAGHEVIAEARDGEEAIKRALELRPDLVTLDLVMPRRDGLSTLAEMRHLDPRARVIICSAWLTQPRVTTALRLGAKGFVSKPFDRATLLAAVDAALSEVGTAARARCRRWRRWRRWRRCRAWCGRRGRRPPACPRRPRAPR